MKRSQPEMEKSRKRSVVWKFFKSTDSHAVECLLCGSCLLRPVQGSTGNMLKHLRIKHPLEASGMSTRRGAEGSGGQLDEEGEPFSSVEVALEDGDPNNISLLNEAAFDGILEASQGGPAEEITQTERSEDCPAGRMRHKRSLIWKYFERLDSLGAARCNICMKKLQYFKNGATSNLRRHMSKRHPKVFSELMTNGQHPPPLNSSQNSNANGETEETFCATKQLRAPGPSKVSGASERERRVLRREKELIEALRRTQKEETLALEQQRELLEKLRTVDAREAAAEREKIEVLRKAQQEEAEDLRRQREELQKERAELEKKWDELRQEREGFLLFSKEQQTS